MLVTALLDAEKPVELASQKIRQRAPLSLRFSFAIPVKSLDKIEYDNDNGIVRTAYGRETESLRGGEHLPFSR